MKRLFWLGVGAIAGASGTVWAERKVRTQIEALQPDHLAVAAGHKAVAVGRTVVDAVLDGRDAMRDREFELRGRYDRPAARHREGELLDLPSSSAVDLDPRRGSRRPGAGTRPEPLRPRGAPGGPGHRHR
jgi:hypothetical protein